MTRLHRALDDRPISFWLRGLGVIVFLSFALSGYAVIKQSQAAAAVTADKKAQAVTQVGQCFQSRRNAPSVLRILSLIDAQGQLIETLATNSIIANQQAIAKSPGDPLNPVRRSSLERLGPARDQIRAGRPAITSFIDRTAAQIPSKAKCNDMAKALGVDPKKLNQP